MKKKHLFQIALNAKSLETGEKWTAERFAAEHNIGTTFLYELLRGKGTSSRMEPIIDEFINSGLRYTQQIEAVAA